MAVFWVHPDLFYPIYRAIYPNSSRLNSRKSARLVKEYCGDYQGLILILNEFQISSSDLINYEVTALQHVVCVTLLKNK